MDVMGQFLANYSAIEDVPYVSSKMMVNPLTTKTGQKV